jgi:glycosyltransferase involved in cell wall biosynthesis
MNLKPLRIGLVYTGGRSWIGGETYLCNILHAITYCKQNNLYDRDIEVVICYEDENIGEHVRSIFYMADRFQCVQSVWDPLRKRDQAISILNLYVPLRFRFLKPRERFCYYMVSDIDILFPYDFYRRLPSRVKAIGWIPDFQPRNLPQFFTPDNLKHRLECEERIISSADHIVFSSHDSISNFQKFFPASQAKAHLFHFNTFVKAEAFSENPTLAQLKYNLPDKFILCCNQFWQHKNHMLLFEAIAAAAKQYPDLFFVFTGHTNDERNSHYFDDLCARINVLSIRTNIAILGVIPRNDQLQLMRKSMGVIQPSLSEGWSTVVEDIRALAKPCILSDLNVHLEQNPDKAWFFDKSNLDSLTKAICFAWNTWLPGPTLNDERLAYPEILARMEKMGINFFAIINQAIQPS